MNTDRERKARGSPPAFTTLIIHYDSTLAADGISGESRLNENTEMLNRARKLLHECRKTCHVNWKWVKGHSGNIGNEEADKLADRGAQGHDEWDVDEPGPEEEMDHFLEGECAEFWAAMSPRREQNSELGGGEEETHKPSCKELSTTYAGCAERVVGRKVPRGQRRDATSLERTGGGYG